MKKRALWAQSMVLLVFLALFFVLNLAIPDRSFSEQENRYLQEAPRFRFSELFSGRFTTQFETYVTDQFAFRDRWTSLKARVELLLGKNSNNGIYLCENETLIEPFSAPEESDLKFNLDAVNTLQENVDIPVYFALIPSASEIWAGLLPDGAPNDSQKAVIQEAYAYVNCSTVDLYSVLESHADEAIFYRTDHHWTTLGAYYGYTALADAMGFEAAPLSYDTASVVSDSFYGTAHASSGFSWVSPDSITTYVSQGDAVITNYPQGAAEAGTLYDESALASRDKYKYFYGGNTPLLTIETGTADAPDLLILRDSYMDSLSPYLMANFSTIHILDLRYYRTSLKAYIESNAFDEILVCYSVKNFCEDGNLFLAGQ